VAWRPYVNEGSDTIMEDLLDLAVALEADGLEGAVSMAQNGQLLQILGVDPGTDWSVLLVQPNSMKVLRPRSLSRSGSRTSWAGSWSQAGPAWSGSNSVSLSRYGMGALWMSTSKSKSGFWKDLNNGSM